MLIVVISSLILLPISPTTLTSPLSTLKALSYTSALTMIPPYFSSIVALKLMLKTVSVKLPSLSVLPLMSLTFLSIVALLWLFAISSVATSFTSVLMLTNLTTLSLLAFMLTLKIMMVALLSFIPTLPKLLNIYSKKNAIFASAINILTPLSFISLTLPSYNF